MKDLLEWIDNQGGIGSVLLDIGLGLFCLISLVKCAAG